MYKVNLNKFLIIILLVFSSLIYCFDENLSPADKELSEQIRNILSSITKVNIKTNLMNIRNALNKGANPNLKGEFGKSILHIAVINNNLDLVKDLIEKYKVDLNSLDLLSLSPLNMAISLHNFDIAEYLISKDANVNFAALESAMDNAEIYHSKYFVKNKKRKENQVIKLIRTLLCKNVEFDQKFVDRYKNKVNPVIIKLFSKINEIRAKKIKQGIKISEAYIGSCPIELARIIAEYASMEKSEELEESGEEKEESE